MLVVVLALDGAFDTGLAVFLDTLGTANEVACLQGTGPLPFDVRLAGVRPEIRTAMGMRASPEAAASLPRPDWVVVPAINAKQPDRVVAALGRDDVREAVGMLRAWHDAGVGLAAACVGTFLMAEAGVLDGRDATTNWSLAPLFRQRYPRVGLDDARMIAASGRVATAGAAMGHLDLALWLVRQASPELATLVARLLLVDRRPSQARYVVPDFVAHADPLVERFERWARANLAAGFSLQAAARALAVSPRTLQRRVEGVLGRSPRAFVQDIRVERAQHLIAQGGDLQQIAEDVGYAESATLRMLLRRRLGRGVRELRAELAG